MDGGPRWVGRRRLGRPMWVSLKQIGKNDKDEGNSNAARREKEKKTKKKEGRNKAILSRLRGRARGTSERGRRPGHSVAAPANSARASCSLNRPASCFNALGGG